MGAGPFCASVASDARKATRMPLIVVAGSAGEAARQCVFSDRVLETTFSTCRFNWHWKQSHDALLVYDAGRGDGADVAWLQ